MANDTPLSRRVKAASTREIGTDASTTIGSVKPNGTSCTWHTLTATTPKPIWATGASEISPIQPRTEIDSTTMATMRP